MRLLSVGALALSAALGTCADEGPDPQQQAILDKLECQRAAGMLPKETGIRYWDAVDNCMAAKKRI